MSFVPYWRLSSFYFVYFAAVGVISPYWPVYLDELGFSGQEIGLLVALPMITRVIAPNLWGALADVSGSYLRVIQLGALAAIITFSGLFFVDDFRYIVIFSCLYTFFWTAILPQFEVITLDFLGPRAHSYSRIRLWGSIGFIVAVVGLGSLLELFHARLILWAIWALLMGIFVTSLTVPRAATSYSRQTLESGAWWQVLKRPEIRHFLFAAVLLHMSHGAFYSFYSLFLLENAYSSWWVGCLWAVGVIAEIILFLKAPSILKRFSLRRCFALSIAAAAIRWLLLGLWVSNVYVVVATQLLHAFTFGLAHAVAIEFVRAQFPSVMKGKAQAFYGAVCFGGGGAIGAYLSGLVWTVSHAGTYWVASVMASLGFIVVVMGKASWHAAVDDDSKNRSKVLT